MANYISKDNLQQYSTEVTAKYKKLFIPSNEVYAEDKVPYLFKATGDGSEMGTRMTDKVIGGTVVWNQLSADIYKRTLTNYTVAGTDSLAISSIYSVVGHCYLLMNIVTEYEPVTSNLQYRLYYDGIAHAVTTATGDIIYKATVNSDIFRVNFSSSQVGQVITKMSFAPVCVDLTQMFGSTIADYIYNLEQTTVGAGVAWFKQYFPKDYYAYNTGELMSVKAGSHNTIGFNQWDEEWEVGTYSTQTGEKVNGNSNIRSKNTYRCLPATQYYLNNESAVGGFRFLEFDVNNNFIKSTSMQSGVITTTAATYSFVFFMASNYGTTYNHDICINISNTDKNGTYEPYIKHTYPLDNNLELRGIPKLDSDNKLYYDGDLYGSNGKVTRKYGIVDLGSLSWTYDSQYSRLMSSALTNCKYGSVRTLSAVCTKYIVINDARPISDVPDKSSYIAQLSGTSDMIYVVHDSSYTDAATFTTAMSGVYLVYELATATSETADPYVNPQVINSFGTEEYIDYAYAAGTRDVAIPVGHDSIYADAFLEKLENAPDNPYKDGDFIVNSKDGFNSYTELDPWLEENGYSKTTALLDTTLSIAGKAADAKAVGDAVTAEEERAEDTYAKQKGSYPDLSSGQLLSTVKLQDKIPYNFRAAGGSADIGIDLTEKVIGGTLAWNQLVQNGNFASTSGWSAIYGTLTVSNNVGTLTSTNVNDALRIEQSVSLISGHKYLFYTTVTPSATTKMAIGLWGTTTHYASNTVTLSANVKYTQAVIIQAAENKTIVRYYCDRSAETSIGTTFAFENLMIFDLTAMFGSTIADYLYSLEQANAGDGVAWFKKLFLKDYYAYNAGSLESVKAGSHDTTGFNQWDEEWESGAINASTGANEVDANKIRSKNFIEVVPNTNYYFYFAQNKPIIAYFYDANKNYLSLQSGVVNSYIAIATNCHFIKFVAGSSTYPVTTYNNDICINLHWDGERDGEYEPYVKHIYELDNSLELRGIPKLDANNDLYYDGDEYESDGTVTRRYGIVDLGTLTYAYVSQSGVFYLMPNSIPSDFGGTRNARCSAYTIQPSITSADSIPDKAIEIRDASTVYLRNNAYTDPAALKAAMSGVYLVYELATPTTESATPYTNPQKVSNWGTEQYVDYAYEAGTRDMEIPVGHDSFYTNDLRAKVEMAPNSPDGDGYYIVHQHNGINTYTSPDDIALTEAEYQEIYNTLISGNA